jgi:TolB protein
VKDLKSGDERRLTFRGSYNASPAWSPQGNWILFTGKTSTGSFDIYVIDATSGYTTPLVVHPRGDEDPAWSPDGRKIVFSSARRGRKELYQVDFDGRNLRRIVDGMGNSTNPAWSPWLD